MILDECFIIVKYLNLIWKNLVVFLEIKWIGIELVECFCWFGFVIDIGLGYLYVFGKEDCLIFEVDRDIFLFGVIFFGRRNCDYFVVI